ncbi:MAG: hypothetical protein EB107_09170, partial [Proteobacteria bacterium]|nr:hypothetical protein [Pseudomonadota bacterium]
MAEDLVNDPRQLVAYGLFYRGDRPYIPVLVGVRLDEVRPGALRLPINEWCSTGVTGVCLDIRWAWHASGGGGQDDEPASVVAEAIALASEAGLDVWVMANMTDAPPGLVGSPPGRPAIRRNAGRQGFPSSWDRDRANKWLETLASSVSQGNRAPI